MLPKRTKLDITLLSPTSAVKVFCTVKIYSSLDINRLKPTKHLRDLFVGQRYSPLEKYFIGQIIKEHLNYNNRKSYLNKILEEYEDLGESEDLINWRDTIYKYVDEINAIISVFTTTMYRRSIVELKYNLTDFKDQHLQFTISSWKKLPIIQKYRKKFINELSRNLKIFYTKDQIRTILENSFSINSIDSPITLLYFEFENSTEIYNAFHAIYKVYKDLLEEDFRDQYDKIYAFNYEQYGERLKTDDHLKNGLHDFKDYYLKASDRINFAKLMFITFPQIRDTFIRKWDFIKLDEFLNSISSNITPRKK